MKTIYTFSQIYASKKQSKSSTVFGYYIPEIQETLNYRITDYTAIIVMADLMAIKMVLERGQEIQESNNKNIKN